MLPRNKNGRFCNGGFEISSRSLASKSCSFCIAKSLTGQRLFSGCCVCGSESTEGSTESNSDRRVFLTRRSHSRPALNTDLQDRQLHCSLWLLCVLWTTSRRCASPDRTAKLISEFFWFFLLSDVVRAQWIWATQDLLIWQADLQVPLGEDSH
jgi:hypothetical protein